MIVEMFTAQGRFYLDFPEKENPVEFMKEVFGKKSSQGTLLLVRDNPSSGYSPVEAVRIAVIDRARLVDYAIDPDDVCSDYEII